jgi:hypothetical protein
LKQAIVHEDILGQPLSEGNYVAISHHNMMYVCQVKKLNPKMMRVVPIQKGYRSDDGFLKYSDQCVLLSGPDALVYILKYSGT